jgi:hypothetical protein
MGAALSDTDSFIEEVSEEVRRDKLFAMFRKYGWIAGLGVVLIVGGAAFVEYQRASQRAAAEAAGDAIYAALDANEADGRVSALQGLDPVNSDIDALVNMLASNEALSAEDRAAATKALEQVAQNGQTRAIYRDLAAFKALVLREDMDTAQKINEFSALAVPGNPFRVLAEEQIALLDLQQGKQDAAIERINALLEDAETTTGLRQRLTQLKLALGVAPSE